jgi:hypothetical protein
MSGSYKLSVWERSLDIVSAGQLRSMKLLSEFGTGRQLLIARREDNQEALGTHLNQSRWKNLDPT